MRHRPSLKRLVLVLEPEIWRLPDRGKRWFGKGRRAELAPIGRAHDIYGDVLVTLARVRAMEARSAEACAALPQGGMADATRYRES